MGPVGDLDATRWTIGERAAAGRGPEREDFAILYEPAVRAYFAARWKGSAYARLVDDAVQDLFLDLFRDGGALQRVDPDRPGGFRAFLYGVARDGAAVGEGRRRLRRTVRATPRRCSGALHDVRPRLGRIDGP